MIYGPRIWDLFKGIVFAINFSCVLKLFHYYMSSLVYKRIQVFLNEIRNVKDENAKVPKNWSLHTILWITATHLPTRPQYTHRNCISTAINTYNLWQFQENSFILPSRNLYHCSCDSALSIKFKCSACNSTYVIFSINLLRFRISQHLLISYRTRNRVTTVNESISRKYTETHDNSIREQDFTIIVQPTSASDTILLESL